MTITEYYANLLIMQYHGQPRARATIEALVLPVTMNNLPNLVQDGFDVNTAIGVQLDTLGIYTGVSRNGNGPSGPITLSDDDFRSLIKMAIVTNNSGSSLSDIQNLLHTFFPNQLFVFDNQHMGIGYYIDSDVGSLDLVIMFINQGLLPKPMGVQLASVIYNPTLNTFFGCGTYFYPAHDVSPFNTYSSYNMDSPWLSYQDAVVV